MPFVVLVIGLLAAGLVSTLWLSTSSAQASYAIGTAQEHNQQLTEQAEGLRRDVASKGSASALAEQAAALGMIPAGDVAHLVVGADGTVTVVGVPKAAAATPDPAPTGAAAPAPAAPPAPVVPAAPPAPAAPAAPAALAAAQAPATAVAPGAKPGAGAGTPGPNAPVGIQPGADPAANVGGA